MSQSNAPSIGGTETNFRIPSLLTNSLRAIFDLFGENIIDARARGSVHTDNPTKIDHLSEYGVTHDLQENQVIEVDYTLIDPEDPYNPLKVSAQDDILSEVDARLNDLATDHPPDLAITRFVTTVESDEMMNACEARTSQFDLQFISEPAIDPYRGRTQELNRERGLYRDLGFEVRNLNLHAIYETQQRYADGPGDGKVMSWGVLKDTRARAPDPLVRQVYNEILPNDIGALKLYTITDEETVEPVSEVTDEEKEENQLEEDRESTENN